MYSFYEHTSHYKNFNVKKSHIAYILVNIFHNMPSWNQHPTKFAPIWSYTNILRISKIHEKASHNMHFGEYISHSTHLAWSYFTYMCFKSMLLSFIILHRARSLCHALRRAVMYSFCGYTSHCKNFVWRNFTQHAFSVNLFHNQVWWFLIYSQNGLQFVNLIHTVHI